LKVKSKGNFNIGGNMVKNKKENLKMNADIGNGGIKKVGLFSRIVNKLSDD